MCVCMCVCMRVCVLVALEVVRQGFHYDIYPQVLDMSSSGVYISRPVLKEGNSKMHWVLVSLDFPGLLGIKACAQGLPRGIEMH